ncbi:MAG: hypothetical protein IH840_15770 [Candidatus Heimdallarchaeota archaeon]|nr:hypothetical protein [Candidatus Heimdallarchaeota archaeon]
MPEIRAYLLREISKGRSVQIDQLANALKRYDWEMIENTITDLIDEEIFDISESSSKKKILGRYGMLIRR